MEELLAQLLINTFEERVLVMFDVSGSYLNTGMPEDMLVLLNLEDEFVDIMCKVNPEFIKIISTERQ